MEPLADITNSNTAQDRQNRRSSMGTTPNGKSRRRSLLDSTSKVCLHAYDCLFSAFCRLFQSVDTTGFMPPMRYCRE